MAQRSGVDRSDYPGAALLREFRQTHSEIAQTVSGGFGYGVLFAWHPVVSRTGAITVSGAHFRGLRGIGNFEEPGELRREKRDLSFPGPAGTGSGLSGARPRRKALDDRMQGREDRTSANGESAAVAEAVHE